ncbi:transcription factor Myb3, partial [Volvox carteri f. nagariensis]
VFRFVSEHGATNWKDVATVMNKAFSTGRTAKQCKDMWFDHLSPTLRRSPWTYEEDMLLMAAHQALGDGKLRLGMKKWRMIAERIPGRSGPGVQVRRCDVRLIDLSFATAQLCVA